MKENGLYGAHTRGCQEWNPDCLCNRCVYDDNNCCFEYHKKCNDNDHDSCPGFEQEQGLIVDTSPAWEELQRERDMNIQGLPPKDTTMRSAPKCRGCIEKKHAVCICCLNFPVCSDNSRKPDCWVSERCAGCVRRLW